MGETYDWGRPLSEHAIRLMNEAHGLDPDGRDRKREALEKTISEARAARAKLREDIQSFAAADPDMLVTRADFALFAERMLGR